MRKPLAPACLACVLLVLIVPLVCTAQRTTAVRSTAVANNKTASFIKIDDLTGLSKRDRVKTPVYNSSANRSINQPQEWGQFLVMYEISPNAPEWIDGIIFQYYVISVKATAPRERIYSMFKKTVRYSDIHNEAGRRMLHKSAVYLRPQALERYGMLEAVAVEIIYDGKVIASKSETAKGSKLPSGEWWKNDNVIKSDKVKNREGYLLNKDESPFSLINIDDYELIR